MAQIMGESTDHDAVSTPNMFLDYAVGNLTAHVVMFLHGYLAI